MLTESPALRESNHPRALIVFMKAPEPGRCKTRLCPPLSPSQAATLYRALCRDTMDAVLGVAADLWIAYEPGNDFPTPRWISDAPFFPQTGESLGDRLTHAFHETFQKGYTKVVAVGTDAPALRPERIEEALSALENSDAVFGPARDGGYYLVGLTSPHPEIFHGIPWSTPRVLDATRRALERTGVSASFLSPETDVDTGEDLDRLVRELACEKPIVASATRAALAARGAPDLDRRCGP